MELTDQEWLREVARQFEEAYRYPDGAIRVSDEFAKEFSERMRRIAENLDADKVLA